VITIGLAVATIERGGHFGVGELVGFEQQEAHAHVAHVDTGRNRGQVDLDVRIAAVADAAVEAGELVDLEDRVRLHGLHIKT
jgi:hypothetical protein